MPESRKINTAAIIILVIPLIISYYLMNQQIIIWSAPVFHFYYVGLSALISLGMSIFAYLEYKKSNITRIFLISLGFLGVAVIYGFHGLITPNYTLFDFPDLATHINAFVFFGDASRFWFALLIFIPEFWESLPALGFGNKKIWLFISILLLIFSLFSALNPVILPAIKYADGRDTYFTILFKVITLIILGIVVLKYYASYRLKQNLSVLSLIIGLMLILETVIIFMISQPWSLMWWLAHNLFLLSFITIGLGIIYSYFTDEKFEYFNIMAHAKSYITDLEATNKELDYLANYDSLTGLANRNYFLDKLEEKIKIAQDSDKIFSLLYIDLDNFKAINDTHGHKIGDEVLKVAAGRIKNNIKANDFCARLGGDEFIVLVDNVNKSEAELVADRLSDFLSDSIITSVGKCQIGASIGVAIYLEDGDTSDQLIKVSDKRMYQIKNHNKFLKYNTD